MRKSKERFFPFPNLLCPWGPLTKFPRLHTVPYTPQSYSGPLQHPAFSFPEQLTWGQLAFRGSSPLALEGPPRMGFCEGGLQSSGKGLGIEGREVVRSSSSRSLLCGTGRN